MHGLGALVETLLLSAAQSAFAEDSVSFILVWLGML